ncbi:hypothetical protein GCM10025857_06190 [Alicyclobacillus contaminans]|uniref:glycosyltransferase family 4 protein n=1 Tax=Alicyclobacillus contaminans TaxID=392016 RepID=UPI000407AB27|nr:glycosyltransferase family 4 protein [Alicyclobacillus contaminans]GMA49262.1 hypothetical protein GCM10025857_06190 [Alicyclobacillus contaminans]
MTRVVYVSTYVPKKCGLATYTHHLRQSVQRAAAGTDLRDGVVAMVDSNEDIKRYDESIWFIRRDQLADYERVAKRINQSSVDVVSLQHEFGIFGGTAGEHILAFARALEKPLVTTFHTVFERPASPYREIQRALIQQSAHITVMNRRAVQYLRDAFGVSTDRISYIPHGTPGPSAKPRSELRTALGWQGRRVILTFGLLGPSKGIESILEVLPDVVAKVPDVLYVIAGQTHPEILKHSGEAYRERLQQMVEERNLSQHVQMVNRYMSESDVMDYVSACDLYITPYPGMEQITSGTLAYAVGAGCPVLSTPYAYARDVLRNLESLLIPYGNREQWSRSICRMLTDEAVQEQYRRQIAEIGRGMQWTGVGAEHLALFRRLAAVKRVKEGSEAFIASR